MPDLSIPGRYGAIHVAPASGQSFQNFGGIVDFSIDTKIGELDTTSHDSGNTRRFLPNFREYTATIKAHWQDGDPGQIIVANAADVSGVIPFEAFQEINPGRQKLFGDCFATAFTPGAPLDGVASLDCNLRMSNVQRTTQ